VIVMSQVFRRFTRLLVAVLVLGTIRADAAPTEGPTPPEKPRIADSPEALPALAEAGDFAAVLASLQLRPGADDPRVSTLIHDLQRYQEAHQRRDTERRDAYTKACVRMKELADKGKLLRALHAAVEAEGLSTDHASFLADPAVAALTAQAQTQAAAAEQNDDWVEALSLYRALDLLMEDEGIYRPDVKRAAKHLRVLRLYAPSVLEKLYHAQAQRLRDDAEDDAKQEPAADAPGSPGKDVAEQAKEAVKLGAGADDAPADMLNPADLNDEDWHVRLRDIELPMLRQTLAKAAKSHVSDTGYLPLMQGALESMLVMVRSKGLDEDFPAFADPKALDEFTRFLERSQADLDQPAAKLNFPDAATLIDKITLMNDKTLKLPEPVLVYELTEGVTDALDDFTAVIWPEEKDNFSRSTQGKFFGVGIQISRRDGRLVVVSPLEGTPAMRAGIKAGDAIVQVDGRDTASWTLDQAVREITGPQDTIVTLGIERPGEPDIRQFPIKRAEIIVESIKGWAHRDAGGWDYYIDPISRIAYVRLLQFVPQTADDLDAAVNQMQKEGGVNGLILDLRFNPGGLLSSAIDISDRFIESGPIVSTVDAFGSTTFEARASRSKTYPNFPVVVLVNQGSASASEIVAGALQDYARAVIVGTRSFGKGSVQDLYPIDGGKAYLKLTTQYYKLPRGRIIHRQEDSKAWGIEPDLKVEMTDQQVADALKFRQDIDVIRDPRNADATAPQAVPFRAGPDEAPKPPAPAAGTAKPAAGDAAAATEEATTPGTAADILTRSLDPQLDTALLILKTRLVSRQIAVAQR
jgi:carboxyl-terminal processing protease